MEISYNGIGNRIRELRMDRGISQEGLAEFANVSPVYISNIECGRKVPSLKTVVSIANALNVSVDTLLLDKNSFRRAVSENAEFMLLKDCSREEADIIISSSLALKRALKKYNIH